MTAANLTWMDQAACRKVPGFTELHQPQQKLWRDTCPVKFECLDYGLSIPVAITSNASDDNNSPLFGGLTPGERRRLLRNRRQAEIRKSRAVAA